jgi:hypothetical protein
MLGVSFVFLVLLTLMLMLVLVLVLLLPVLILILVLLLLLLPGLFRVYCSYLPFSLPALGTFWSEKCANRRWSEKSAIKMSCLSPPVIP